MGKVYRAVHTKLGRKAAVKVLADALANNPEYVSRFFREARIVGEVGHPNIIDILDFVELDSPRVVAYVMELIEGPSLGSMLKTGPLSVVQAINVTLQLLDALMAVHAIDVVHRDLKLENIRAQIESRARAADDDLRCVRGGGVASVVRGLHGLERPAREAEHHQAQHDDDEARRREALAQAIEAIEETQAPEPAKTIDAEPAPAKKKPAPAKKNEPLKKDEFPAW